MEILKGALTVSSGFSIYLVLTHPQLLKKKLPNIKNSKIQILPNLKINLKNQTIHLHHWIWLSAILGFLNHIDHGIDNLFYIKFFTLGGIIQGLSFRDRFHIFIKKTLAKYKLPLISVVIPAYNEAEILAKTLESLKKQDYSGKFEVIVVDNNSCDNTARVAQKYGVKVVFEPQKGAAYARQAGFMAAKGKIIASTDADSILPKNWLSYIADNFNRDPRTVMVSGMYKFYDASPALNFWNWTINYLQFVIFSWYSGANMAVKRDAFIKVGGFNTALPLSEDSDLGVRLRKIGKVLRFANFKVETSARRFNQLGFWGALWDYCYNYAKFKLHIKSEEVNFRSGSEIPRLSLLPKLAIHIIVVAAILVGLLGGAFEIKPVRAQIIIREKQIKQQISKIDVGLSHVNTLRYVHHR